MNKSNKKIAFHFLVVILVFSVVIFQAQGSSPNSSASALISRTLKNVDDLNKEQKYEISLQLLLQALTKYPDDALLRSSFKKTFALHVYREISDGFQRISKNKHDTEAYISVARAYSLIGDSFRAMEILTDGIMDNPASSQLWMVIGSMELQAKRDAEALSVFREVIRIDSRNSHAHNNTAYVLARSRDDRLHDLGQALSHAQTAVALEPNNPNFIDTLAEVRFQMGERGAAVALMRRAIRLAPDEEFFKAQLTRFETTKPQQADESGVFEASENSDN